MDSKRNPHRCGLAAILVGAALSLSACTGQSPQIRVESFAPLELSQAKWTPGQMMSVVVAVPAFSGAVRLLGVDLLSRPSSGELAVRAAFLVHFAQTTAQGPWLYPGDGDPPLAPTAEDEPLNSEPILPGTHQDLRLKLLVSSNQAGCHEGQIRLRYEAGHSQLAAALPWYVTLSTGIPNGPLGAACTPRAGPTPPSA